MTVVVLEASCASTKYHSSKNKTNSIPTLQIIDVEPGATETISSNDSGNGDGFGDRNYSIQERVVKSIDSQHALNVYITDDLQEADSCNNGVIYAVNSLTDDWKPIKIRLIYESWVIIPDAILCRKVDKPSLAGWTDYSSLDDRRSLYQQRPLKFIDWIPSYKKNQYDRKKIGFRYLKTLRPLTVNVDVSKASLVLNRVPANIMLRCSTICRVVEDGEAVTRVKIVSDSIDDETERVQDIHFGSDGWITYQVGDDSDKGSNKYCDWIAYNAKPPVYFFPIRINNNTSTNTIETGEKGPYIFNAWKISSTSNRNIFSLFAKSSPQSRCFRIDKGCLQYYSDEATMSINPSKGIKNRKIPISIIDIKDRNVMEDNVGQFELNRVCLSKIQKKLVTRNGLTGTNHFKVLMLSWDCDKDSSSCGDAAKSMMILLVENINCEMIMNAFTIAGANSDKAMELSLGLYN